MPVRQYIVVYMQLHGLFPTRSFFQTTRYVVTIIFFILFRNLQKTECCILRNPIIAKHSVKKTLHRFPGFFRS